MFGYDVAISLRAFLRSGNSLKLYDCFTHIFIELVNYPKKGLPKEVIDGLML